ncbi:hypothetical protein HZY97_01120 [Sphingomonas sp. R-74633]|uniref:hypothetical protein n=1 Tax=Sphingomonas sp. R-74633 TaxID=2751188 RepID=UPI0015D10DA0|nr:hypothetical protein [Sphingomonas sp. R-74633]NYT39345.1 hypothetical protein [Sphingomonas sp. R-74633]
MAQQIFLSWAKVVPHRRLPSIPDNAGRQQGFPAPEAAISDRLGVDTIPAAPSIGGIGARENDSTMIGVQRRLLGKPGRYTCARGGTDGE